MPKLTKSLIDQNNSNDKDYFVWDSEVKGFGCRIWPSGKKTYMFFYRSPLTQKKIGVKIGVHGHITVDEARIEVKKLSAEIASGSDPKEEKQKKMIEQKKIDDKDLNFKDFLPIFIERHSKIYNKPTTQKVNEQQFKTHILPFFCNKELKAITKQDILKFKDSLKQYQTTANRCLKLISCVFNKAIAWDYLSEGRNPCLGITKYKENKKERFLAKNEIDQLSKTLTFNQDLQLNCPYVLGVIQMLMYTGCRKSEILTLKWADVQLDQNCLHLKDSKTGEKIVPLNSLSKAVLESLEPQPNNPYVFCGKKPGGHLTDVKKTWTKIRKMLNIEDVRMHDLRHTFASMAIKSGLGLYQVSKLLGHSNIQTTMRYAHIEKEELVKSAKAVEAVFANV